jgi:hypothetical protein
MNRIPLLLVGLLLLATMLASTPTAAQASPAYFEKQLFTDASNDINVGGYDILGVYATERFRFQFDTAYVPLGDGIFFRIVPRNIDENPNSGLMRYHIHYTLNGQSRETWADVGVDQGVAVVKESNASFAQVKNKEVIIVVGYDMATLTTPSVTSVWAATSAIVGPQRVWFDVAPRDNQGAPAGTSATAPATTGSYTIRGPFPFVRVDPASPLRLNSVQGAEVRFAFRVVPDANVSGELVRFLFTKPAGWAIEPSRGEGGANPIGSLPNIGPLPVDFSVSVNAPLAPPIGTLVAFPMEMVSGSGSHQVFNLTVNVTGPKILDPNYSFQAASALKAKQGETARLLFTVLNDGAALDNESLVSADFIKDGQVVATVDGRRQTPEAHEIAFNFPSEGDWTIDVYVSSLKPSPHQEFAIKVSSGGVAGLPGPSGPLVVLALVALALVLRRR